MREVIVGIVSASGTALVLWVGSVVKTAVRKRVHIRSPEAETLAQVVPAINITIELIGPILVGLKAVIEAEQGIRNGNLIRAGEVINRACEIFDTYRTNTAKVD